MRVALLVAIVVTHAHAEPKTPEVVAAERAWAAAEVEKDPRAAIPLWKTAARAFEAAAGKSPNRELLHSAIVAWRSARIGESVGAHDLGAPLSWLTPDEAAYAHDIDEYLAAAPPDELPSLLFSRAHLAYQHNRFEEALPLWNEIVTKHPAHESAEFAATLLLDTLNRRGKFDELVAAVERMRADPKLVANRSMLRATLTTLHVQALRKQAEAHQAIGRTGDRAGFENCGKIHRDAYLANPTYDRRDELLFNAGMCFAAAGKVADARQAYRDVIARFPKSPLVASARQRLADLPP
jgi:tetratricopeptide (TPR) repeat protein